MNNSNIKIRWLTTTGFEVVLPNGKVMVFDPWFGGKMGPHEFKAELTAKDLSGCDYIFLSHTHGDHIDGVAEVNELYRHDSYGGRIFMPALSAYIFCQQRDIAYRDVIPMLPNESFETEDFVVTCHRCRHFGDIGSPKGSLPSKQQERLKATGGDPAETYMGSMGSIEEVDLSITIKANNFRFMVLGGRIYRFDNINKFSDTFNPNFVIRQVSPGFTPKDYAEIVARYHAPIVFPSHHDSHDLTGAQGMSFEEYFGKVNEILESMGSVTRVVNIERSKWYEIGQYCSAVEL